MDRRLPEAQRFFVAGHSQMPCRFHDHYLHEEFLPSPQDEAPPPASPSTVAQMVDKAGLQAHRSSSPPAPADAGARTVWLLALELRRLFRSRFHRSVVASHQPQLNWIAHNKDDWDDRSCSLGGKPRRLTASRHYNGHRKFRKFRCHRRQLIVLAARPPILNLYVLTFVEAEFEQSAVEHG